MQTRDTKGEHTQKQSAKHEAQMLRKQVHRLEREIKLNPAGTHTHTHTSERWCKEEKQTCKRKDEMNIEIEFRFKFGWFKNNFKATHTWRWQLSWLNWPHIKKQQREDGWSSRQTTTRATADEAQFERGELDFFELGEQTVEKEKTTKTLDKLPARYRKTWKTEIKLNLIDLIKFESLISNVILPSTHKHGEDKPDKRYTGVVVQKRKCLRQSL